MPRERAQSRSDLQHPITRLQLRRPDDAPKLVAVVKKILARAIS
jgi:hypothetical protein